MKILFLTDNFPPEVNAPATRTYEHCREWVKKGIEVTVITCAPNFPQGKVYYGYKNKLRKTEWIDGIKVIRVWSYITANEGFIKRILDYISYATSAFFTGLFIKTDIIIATSPQLFTAICGRWLSFFKRKPWIFEVRDIWPEGIVAGGGMKRESLAFKILEKIELKLYKKALFIVVVTNSFKENLISRGCNPNKITVITNGSNRKLFKPKEKNQAILEKLKIQDKTVFGYIGTLGMAHGIEFLIDCFSKINNNNYFLLILGDGARKKEINEKIKKENITNVVLLNSVPKSKVVDYISILDYSIVNLRKTDMYKTVIPSKIFEYASMGKPILIGVDGETKKIIEDNKCGIFYEPENENALIKAIDQIIDPDLSDKLKEGCFQMAKKYDRVNLAITMLKEINKRLHEINKINSKTINKL